MKITVGGLDNREELEDWSVVGEDGRGECLVCRERVAG